MARKRRRPVTQLDVDYISEAANYLWLASVRLHLAGAYNALAYVQRARKSVKGAENHAQGLLSRKERG